MKIAAAAALAASLLTLAAPASATTYVGSTFGNPDPGATGNLVIDFESALPTGISFLSGSAYRIYQGTIVNRGVTPGGDTTKYLSVPGVGAAGTATLDFSGYTGAAITDFSFYWGSIDLQNSFSVVTNLGTLVITGGDVFARTSGHATRPSNNQRVYFDLAPGETLSQLVFSTTRPAFETDDFVFNTAAVPEPATWAMMVLGFGSLGGMLRRRKASSQQAIASL